MKFKLRPLLIIFIATILVFLNILDNEFVWDDFPLIVESDVLRNWGQIGNYFTTPFWTLAIGQPSPYYRPLFPVLVLLISLFSGTAPLGYHLFSLIMHAISTWLIFRILQKLKNPEWLTWTITLIFLLHPIHVQAVAWAAAVNIPFGSVLFLTALHLFIRGRSKGKPLSAPITILISVLYLLGLLSYELTAALPCLMLAYDLLYTRSSPSDILKSKKKTPYLVLAILFAGWFFLRSFSLRSFHAAGIDFSIADPYTANILYSGTWWETWVRPLNVLSRYLELCLFPLILPQDHYFGGNQMSFSAIACLLFFIVLCVYVFKKADRPLFGLGLTWFLTPLIPVLHIVPTGGQFADRYLYLASGGIIIIFGLALDTFCIQFANKRNIPWRKFYLTALVPLLLFYAGRTFYQNQIWQNNLLFWINTTNLSPHKPQTHNELGGVLYRGGHRKEAMLEFETSARIAPRYVVALNNLAVMHKENGDLDEAEKYMARVQELLAGKKTKP